MQYVKDDMDEQFRKAAENYPLDTSGADWSKVLKGLESPVENAEPIKSNNTRLLWLLLLLPMALICNRYYNRSGIDQDVAGTSGHEIEKVQDKNLPVKGRQDESYATGQRTDESSGEIVDKPAVDKSIADSKKQKAGPESNRSGEISSEASVAKQDIKTPAKPSGFRAESFGGKNQKDAFGKNQRVVPEENLPAPVEQTMKTYSPVFFTYNIPQSARQSVLLAPFKTIPRNLVPGEIPLPGKTGTGKDKRFYAGIMGGVDVTTIKFQDVENAGYDYGLVLGYDLNKKLAIEAGLFMDKKFYYTDGKYFNTSKIYMPPNSEVTEVSGDCRMWEIPVSLRYNFNSKKRSSWFATAGMTSYIMKKEQYDYLYYYGSTGNYAWHNKSYSNSSTNLFSAIHISGGYTRHLGKIADLRIEPYLKIPVSKMGYGELPLLSSGIHIGLTKKLF